MADQIVEFFRLNKTSILFAEGAILLWDNQRLVHGRSAYSDPHRHLTRYWLAEPERGTLPGPRSDGEGPKRDPRRTHTGRPARRARRWACRCSDRSPDSPAGTGELPHGIRGRPAWAFGRHPPPAGAPAPGLAERGLPRGFPHIGRLW
ncbi:TauD/TfdA family dioxygenase [Streptomyces sp. NPDC060054]|uniref:TauD/TfdA family dioxygenase n=1 Tax=unclassified Streptomyces TaxID=2593676 RepID=UPI000D1B1C7A